MKRFWQHSPGVREASAVRGESPRPLRGQAGLAVSVRTVVGLFLLLGMGSAHGFAAGSPICEVHSLPLVEMSPTLAQPPPSGWYLEASRPVFYPGRGLTVRLRHPDPGQAVRGVLLWAKSAPTEGAGEFALPTNGRWQYMPGSSNCGTWAISHVDGWRKEQVLLAWDWLPGDTATAVLRAFLIQDCPHPAGGCRDQQGLTPLLILERGIFADDFEI